MRVQTIRLISLICTGVTLGALTAHVLELPNKFELSGALWLAVQQNLYSGWGPVIGPFEVAAVVTTWILAYLARKDRAALWLTFVPACLVSGALVVFFVLNAPVNAAFASWTPATMPPNWSNYRLRWELGHAISFGLVLVSFLVLLHARLHDAVDRALSCQEGA